MAEFYNVMIRERTKEFWVYADGDSSSLSKERVFKATERPLTLEDAEEVKAVCENCLIKETDIRRFTNATIYPKGWLKIWIEKAEEA